MADFHGIEEFASRLAALYRANSKVLFLLGAGISVAPPSNVPAVGPVVAAIVDRIAEVIRAAVDEPRLAALTTRVHRMPFEELMRCVFRVSPEPIARLVGAIAGDRPNYLHQMIGRWISRDDSAAVAVTTNFDELLEVAIGTDRLVASVPGSDRHVHEFRLEPKVRPILVKVHGSQRRHVPWLDRTERFPPVAALSHDVARRFPLATRRWLEESLNGSTLVVMGYSGSDYDVRSEFRRLWKRGVRPVETLWIDHRPESLVDRGTAAHLTSILDANCFHGSFRGSSGLHDLAQRVVGIELDHKPPSHDDGNGVDLRLLVSAALPDARATAHLAILAANWVQLPLGPTFGTWADSVLADESQRGSDGSWPLDVARLELHGHEAKYTDQAVDAYRLLRHSRYRAPLGAWVRGRLVHAHLLAFQPRQLVAEMWLLSKDLRRWRRIREARGSHRQALSSSDEAASSARDRENIAAAGVGMLNLAEARSRWTLKAEEPASRSRGLGNIPLRIELSIARTIVCRRSYRKGTVAIAARAALWCSIAGELRDRAEAERELGIALLAADPGGHRILDRAEQHLNQALDIYDWIGWRNGSANVLRSLAWVHLRRADLAGGNPSAQDEHTERALVALVTSGWIAIENGEPLSELKAWYELSRSAFTHRVPDALNRAQAAAAALADEVQRRHWIFTSAAALVESHPLL